MREQDGRNRDGETKASARERFAHVMYPDGVLAWQFHYDFHRTGRSYLQKEGASGPWIDFHKPRRHTKFLSDRSVFPLRSLIPLEMDGLLGAQKNLGYSSIVSAAIRLHDQCIAIGQAAGATAAVSLRSGRQPRECSLRSRDSWSRSGTLCAARWRAPCRCCCGPFVIWPPPRSGVCGRQPAGRREAPCLTAPTKWISSPLAPATERLGGPGRALDGRQQGACPSR